MACSWDWKLILEFLKVLAWPVIVGLAVFCFRQELRALLNRVSSFKIFGQEVATQQAKTAQEPLANAQQQPAAADAAAPPELEGLHLSPAEMANVRAAFQAQQAAARMWEYRFLNYFFAPATQAVLDWLISLGAPTTFDAYDTYWLNRIPAANERQAVIDALQMHHCIQFDAPTIVATDKGREYAGWHERRVIGAPAWALPGANERR